MRPRRRHLPKVQVEKSKEIDAESAPLERVVDALNTIFLHREQEAGRELGPRRARVEERRRRVREVLLRHELVGLDRGVDLRRFRVKMRS